MAATAGKSSGVNGFKATPASAWIGHKGAAAFDFRSDTQTTPTAEMLLAIERTTLLDDVFNEDPTTQDLEAHVAALTGKDTGLFVTSGTMGNQVALRSILTQPPHSVICDYRSHIFAYEAGGVASLSGALVHPLKPKNGIHLTLDEIQGEAVLDDDVHHCPTKVISLENTLGGMIMPLEEIRKISAFARDNGIRMHLDGARLWEAVASGGGSLKDFAECFDTLSLCFSKGLGAPIGSIIVGTKDVIKQARWVRKSIGGGLRQSGVVTAAARVALDTTFGSGPNGEGGLLRETHSTAKRVAKMWTDRGGELECPVHTNMVWLDLNSLNTTDDRINDLGKAVGLKLLGNRLVLHYQIGEEALQRLEGVFQKVVEEKGSGKAANGGSGLYKSH